MGTFGLHVIPNDLTVNTVPEYRQSVTVTVANTPDLLSIVTHSQKMNPMESAATFVQFYERNSCSAQWLAFNRGMAAELSAGLPPEDLRQLFFRIGQRLAQALPVPECETLVALQAQFNARWDGIDWGFSTLQEEADGLYITHACSPIAVAFGPEATDWSVGFFEGVYQSWFDSQRMPASLRVQALPGGTNAGPRIDLRLSRAAA